jgi:hypothetical protein
MDSVSAMQSPAPSITTAYPSRAPRCRSCKLPKKGHPRSGCPNAPATPQHQFEGIPATAPPKIDSAPIHEIRAPRSLSVSIFSIQEEAEATDNVVRSASTRTASPPSTENKYPRLGQHLCAILNATSLSLTKLQDQGLDKWEIRVMGDEGNNIQRWILTVDRDGPCKESNQLTVFRSDVRHCGNPLRTRANPNSLLWVFVGGIVCGIVVTLIILMYSPDDL